MTDRERARKLAEKYLRALNGEPDEEPPVLGSHPDDPAPNSPEGFSMNPTPAPAPAPNAPVVPSAQYRSHNKGLRHVFAVDSLKAIPDKVRYDTIATVLHKKDDGVWSLYNPANMPMEIPRRIEPRHRGGQPWSFDAESFRQALDAMDNQTFRQMFGTRSYRRAIVDPPKPFLSISDHTGA